MVYGTVLSKRNTFLISSWTWTKGSWDQEAKVRATEASMSRVILSLRWGDLRNALMRVCSLFWWAPLMLRIEFSPSSSVIDLGYAGTNVFPWFWSTTLLTSASVDIMIGVPIMFVLNTFPYLYGYMYKDFRKDIKLTPPNSKEFVWSRV